MRRMWSKGQLLNAIEGEDISPNNINASGNITAKNITENPIALSYTKFTNQLQWDDKFVGVCKTGNKITFVFFYSFEYASDLNSNPTLAEISIPSEIAAKLYPYQIGGSNDVLDMQTIGIVSTDWQYKSIHAAMTKGYNKVILKIYDLNSMSLTVGKTYLVRYEATFLLSDSIAE